MQHRIIYPTEALRPYVYRYVFVRADGSTDTMSPPADDLRFVNGKHVQPLLPNYGSLIFMRNVEADLGGTRCRGLVMLGANQRTIGLTTLSGWFEGMLLDFEPGGMHALLGVDLQQLAGKVLTAEVSGDTGLQELDRLFKSTPEPSSSLRCSQGQHHRGTDGCRSLPERAAVLARVQAVRRCPAKAVCATQTFSQCTARHAVNGQQIVS